MDRIGSTRATQRRPLARTGLGFFRELFSPKIDACSVEAYKVQPTYCILLSRLWESYTPLLLGSFSTLLLGRASGKHHSPFSKGIARHFTNPAKKIAPSFPGQKILFLGWDTFNPLAVITGSNLYYLISFSSCEQFNLH